MFVIMLRCIVFFVLICDYYSFRGGHVCDKQRWLQRWWHLQYQCRYRCLHV